jgi:hypothetical protein
MFVPHNFDRELEMSRVAARTCSEARDDCRPPTALFSRFGACRLSPFRGLKFIVKDRRFQTIEEIEENSLQDLCALSQNAFQNWENLVGTGVYTVEVSTLKETSFIMLQVYQ